MAQGDAVHAHVEAAILASAARVLAERGEQASLADVASAAGIARSTLYRYYPNRGALLDALMTAGAREVQEQLADPDLQTLPVREALARVTRGFLAVGAKYSALTVLRPKRADVQGESENGVAAAAGSAGAADAADGGVPDGRPDVPLAGILERGIADGTFRDDLPVGALLAAYSDLVDGAIGRLAGSTTGVESASATLLVLFLDGAAPRAD